MIQKTTGSRHEKMHIWATALGIVLLILVGIVGGYFYYISP